MSLIANNSGLLWNFLRGIALAAAEEPRPEPDAPSFSRRASSPSDPHTRRACSPATPLWDERADTDYDADRVPLSPAVLASGVFVAAMIEEDAERWDGLA